MEQPDETKPRTLEAPRTRRKLTLNIGVIVAVLVVGILAALLATSIASELSTKRNISGARVVSDKVVAAIAKRDGGAARKLGNAKFQSMYTDKQLSQQFRAIEPVTSHDRNLYREALVDKDKTKTALIFYQYPTKDLAYYIRIAVAKDAKTGQWQLTDITGNADLSTL